jgi:hypothetical protein
MSAEAEAEAEGSSVHALELPLIGGVVWRDGLAFERVGAVRFGIELSLVELLSLPSLLDYLCE